MPTPVRCAPIALHDPARAAALFKRACDGGNAMACTHLGQTLAH